MQDNRPKNLQNVLEGNYTVNTSEYISRGWEKFKENPGIFIAFSLLDGILIGINTFLWPIFLDSPLADIISLIVGFILVPLNLGVLIGCFKAYRNQSVEFSDFFKAYNYFSQLVLGTIVSYILIAIGFLLCILPGIYLAIGYSFIYILIIDRNFSFWQAMENSRQIVTKQWFSWFGFIFLLGLINLVGILLCGVGLFVTAPVTTFAIVAAYDDVMGIQKMEY